MEADGLDFETVLTKAEELYREQTLDGAVVWPPALHARDVATPAANLGQL